MLITCVGWSLHSYCKATLEKQISAWQITQNKKKNQSYQLKVMRHLLRSILKLTEPAGRFTEPQELNELLSG